MLENKQAERVEAEFSQALGRLPKKGQEQITQHLEELKVPTIDRDPEKINQLLLAVMREVTTVIDEGWGADQLSEQLSITAVIQENPDLRAALLAIAGALTVADPEYKTN